MTVFTFTLQLLEPLMVTGLEGDPNSNVTLDYIPGSVIRGALISQYLKTKPANYSFDPANKAQDEYKLFFNGSVRYLNAYPSMEHHLEKIRTLPTPLSWVVQKDSKPETDIYDMCCSLLPDEQTKPLSKHFFYQQGKLVWTTKPEHQLTIHTQRERRHGRSTESDGAVFRYESLEAYSQFIGVILVEDDSLTTSIEELLKDKELNLGGSRTAGYGRVNVIDWKEKQDWKEAGEVNDIEKDSTFTITLLSNALVRNDEGQYQLDLPIEELKKHLGAIKEVKSKEDNKGFGKTFKQSEIIGGFNRKWGLPLPQTLSIKAGSVFTFRSTNHICKEKVQQLLDRGIGDRRTEGFGRIAINLNTECELTWKKSKPEESFNTDKKAITSHSSKQLAKRIVERILRQKLDQKLLSAVLKYNVEHTPPNHQISRLRAVVREAMYSGNKNLLKNFFEDNKRLAREHFEKAKIDHTSLSTWIKEKLDNLDAKEFVVILPTLGKNYLQYKTIAAEFTEELKVEYHLRLIDGVLAHAAKKSRGFK